MPYALQKRIMAEVSRHLSIHVNVISVFQMKHLSTKIQKVTSNVAITKKNEKNNTPDYSCKYIAYTCFIPSNFLIKSKYLIGCLI